MAAWYCSSGRPRRAHTSAALDLMKLLNSHGAAGLVPLGQPAVRVGHAVQGPGL